MWVQTIRQMKHHFRFYDKLLNLVHIIKEKQSELSSCDVFTNDRLDDGKAALTIKRLNSLLSESLLDIIDNRQYWT